MGVLMMCVLMAACGLICMTMPARSQRGPAGSAYEDTRNVPVSPEVHPDKSVIFRLFAPKASEVILMGSPGILEVIKTLKPLQKDAQGVWSLTVYLSKYAPLLFRN